MTISSQFRSLSLIYVGQYRRADPPLPQSRLSVGWDRAFFKTKCLCMHQCMRTITTCSYQSLHYPIFLIAPYALRRSGWQVDPV